MTYRISKTILDGQNLGDFPARAAAHAVEMRDWRAHMARVAEDEKNGVVGIERHIPYKQPIEHPLVDAAVNENCEMDYELVDDGPTADQVLRAKKDHLLSAISAAEQQAFSEIIPFGRRRLLNLRDGDIAAVEQDRSNRITREHNEKRDAWMARQIKRTTLINKILNTVFDPKDPDPGVLDVTAEVEKQRAPEDAKHLEEQAERNKKIGAIQRMVAQAQNDVEDLTADNIDDWQAPDFKGT